MSGKCYSCAAEFGFFKKEQGCKNCGYSFCKNCIGKKIAVPRHHNEILKVCNRCYDILTGTIDPAKEKTNFEPPEALQKRLAALENRKENANSSHATNSAAHKTKQNYKGMSSKDIELAERLQKLKDDRRKEAGRIPSQKEIEHRLEELKEKKPPPPSDSDMTKRLAVLKGQDPATATKPFVFKKDNRSEQAQIDDLLEEICDEVEIDSHKIDPAEDINSRLRHLRGQKDEKEVELSDSKKYSQHVPQFKKGDNDGENLDLEEVNRLMKQVAQEMELDAQKALSGLKEDKELMERLNQLKKDRKKNSEESKDTTADAESDQSYDSEDEQEAIKKILKKSLAEAKLEEELEAEGTSVKTTTSKTDKQKGKLDKNKNKSKPIAKPVEEELESDPDEFPWCCICNEDATLRCKGCDYDLYCKRCFKEGHDRLDMPDHKTVPYVKSRKNRGL